MSEDGATADSVAVCRVWRPSTEWVRAEDAPLTAGAAELSSPRCVRFHSSQVARAFASSAQPQARGSSRMPSSVAVAETLLRRQPRPITIFLHSVTNCTI